MHAATLRPPIQYHAEFLGARKVPHTNPTKRSRAEQGAKGALALVRAIFVPRCPSSRVREQSERGREKSAIERRVLFLKANLNSIHGDTLLPRMT
jgi:hypothetical protein